jgi:hypothetical protein
MPRLFSRGKQMATYRNLEISRNQTPSGKPFCVTANNLRPRHWYFDTLAEARRFAMNKMNPRAGTLLENAGLEA